MKKYEIAEVNGFSDIEKCESASFAKIRAYSPDLAETFLSQIILDLTEFFSVGKSMGASQIQSAMKLILKEYYFLKPEDFKLCFSNAKKGVYGAMYDRIDGNVICSWLNVYCNERADYFESKSYSDHIYNKAQPPIVSPEILEEFTKARIEIEKSITKEKEYKDFKQEYNSKQ